MYLPVSSVLEGSTSWDCVVESFEFADIKMKKKEEISFIVVRIVNMIKCSRKKMKRSKKRVLDLLSIREKRTGKSIED